MVAADLKNLQDLADQAEKLVVEREAQVSSEAGEEEDLTSLPTLESLPVDVKEPYVGPSTVDTSIPQNSGVQQTLKDEKVPIKPATSVVPYVAIALGVTVLAALAFSLIRSRK